jgi:hypothetical protein
MQYMLLIYEPEDAYEGEAGQASLTQVVARHMALAAEMAKQGLLLSGNGLQSIQTATTVLTGPGGTHTLHDGPFAETREHLGGYYLIEVADLDAALDWARKVPGVEGAKVEVRPVTVH